MAKTPNSNLDQNAARVCAGEYDPALVGREFVHFKGGRYRLVGYAKDSETCETMVVYQALYGDGGLWVRPAKMFFESVTRDGRTMPRFRPA
jgi:hypothetical protein